MDPTITIALVGAAASLLVSLVPLRKVRLEAQERKRVESELAVIQHDFELLKEQHRQALQTQMAARIRFLELAAESASKVTAALYKAMDHVNAAGHWVKIGDRNAQMSELNALQEARAEATRAACFLSPELDEAYDQLPPRGELGCGELLLARMERAA
jgi:hypothetical protein